MRWLIKVILLVEAPGRTPTYWSWCSTPMLNFILSPSVCSMFCSFQNRKTLCGIGFSFIASTKQESSVAPSIWINFKPIDIYQQTILWRKECSVHQRNNLHTGVNNSRVKCTVRWVSKRIIYKDSSNWLWWQETSQGHSQGTLWKHLSMLHQENISNPWLGRKRHLGREFLNHHTLSESSSVATKTHQHLKTWKSGKYAK